MVITVYKVDLVAGDNTFERTFSTSSVEGAEPAGVDFMVGDTRYCRKATITKSYVPRRYVASFASDVPVKRWKEKLCEALHEELQAECEKFKYYYYTLLRTTDCKQNPIT